MAWPNSFNSRLYDAVVSLCADRGEVSTTEIYHHQHCQTKKQEKRVCDGLSELFKDGRLERVRQGVYRPSGKEGPPEKQEVMWRLLRARRIVSLDDLEELAGVSRDYAGQWIRMLERHGIVKKNGDRWQLINDPGPKAPRDEEKAARLRDLRLKKKKAALEALEAAGAAIDNAKMRLKEMEI